jgi:CubicO group peptidase (beta-lactamase class C family)
VRFLLATAARVLWAFGLAVPAVTAQPKPTAAAPAPATAAIVAPGTAPVPGVHDRAELEAFLDGTLGAMMADKHIAGVTVSVVKDGQLFLAKGYGFADVAKRKPVDPAASMFRIGSITKLFTWTSIMQLAEQGKVDLNKDINEYLDFKIPATYPQPITLKHVLTHTPGLEEDGRDLFTEDPAHITPMGKWLPAHMPKRVRPPGTYSSYSNWATAVAGYIVERVSGMSWDDYIEKNIINPLGMTHTTGRQPLPEKFAADMSQGYQYKDGAFEAKKFEIVTGAAPAGSIGSSAVDMSRFMLAHLGNGALGDVRILQDSTAKLMHTRLFGHDARLPGFAHGFYEQSSHGLRIFGHGGDTGVFHSDLALIPSENLGVFISTNTNTGGAISFQPFLLAFLDHYFPVPLPVITPTEGAKQGAKRYAGEYLMNRMNFSTFQKALSLASPLPIKANDDGSLNLASPFGAMRLVAVDSMLFRDVNSGTEVAFQADDKGNITHGFLDAAPMLVLDKQSRSQSPTLHRNILILGLATFIIVIIAAVVRRFGPRSLTADSSVTTGRRLLVTVAVLQLLFVLVVVIFASSLSGGFTGATTGFKLGLALPVIGVVLTLMAGWIALKLWAKGESTFGNRLRLTATVVIALLFFWSLNTWNLLGWKV